MKLIKLTLVAFLFTFIKVSYAQIESPTSPSFYFSNKEYSKDIALFRAKAYVINELLGSHDETIQFELDPLAAASSGELTSLVYKSTQLNKEGLILGFFGDYWNDAGVIYQGYAFKNLTYEAASSLLNKIDKNIVDNSKYLNSDFNSNNIYFSEDDLTIVISFSGQQTNIRVFWGNFDANWDGTAFKRTKRRFEKKLK